MSWNQSVFSKSGNTVSVGYDSDTKEMLVEWSNGRVSAYEGVPEELAQQVANAPSVTSMVNSDIKNAFPHRYVR